MTSYRQDLNAEEEKLFRSLSRIYRNIKRDMNLELSTPGRVTWSHIQRLYRKQADDAIRSAVTTMYEISARKTVERDIKIPYYLTQKDMEEIRRYTQRYIDWFWIGMQREINNKAAIAFDPKTFLRLDPSKLKLKDTFIGRMTESLHGEIAADAVISKARQVVLDNNRRGNFRNRFTRVTYSASLYRSAQGPAGEPHLVWRTAEDEATCPDCSALNGQVFAIDDPTIITPVEGTHPRCRCELELVEASETQAIQTVEDLFMTDLF